MAEATTAAGAEQSAPAAGTANTTRATRPEVSEAVLAAARKRGKVVMHPTARDVEANPGARGYDQHGLPRPADARAVFLVVPKDVKPSDEPTPADQAAAVRKAGKALREDRRKAAEKAQG
jgi:hypothetical protein